MVSEELGYFVFMKPINLKGFFYFDTAEMNKKYLE